MTVGELIKARRKELGINADTLAESIGVSRATIYRYENGDIERVPGDVLAKIAKALYTTPHYLMGWTNSPNVPVAGNIIPMPSTYAVPLVGTIACGEPILAVEDAEELVQVPEHIKADFALRCKGDSMINARIFDGDIVYIRKQDSVDDGEIAAVLIGDEATLKRVRIFDERIVLEPANPMYAPLTYWREDMDSVRILGKAVAFTSVII